MNKANLEKVLKNLFGKAINKVIAGGSNGSIIVLDIGNSEFNLFVKCVWRLENFSTIITGWNESNNPINGNMTLGIKKLKNDIIESVELTNFYDLKIKFSSNKTLNIFCDVTPYYEPKEYDENWVFCDINNNTSYVITNSFTLVNRPYE